jgi:hypothetical protein
MTSHSNPTIEISRENHKLASVKVVMPVWKRNGTDGLTYINMPLLGISTYGKTPEDVDKAIEETITGFCLASDKFGLGLESELEFFGWTKTEFKNSSVFTLNIQSPVMDEIMDTGFEKAFDLSIWKGEDNLVCA